MHVPVDRRVPVAAMKTYSVKFPIETHFRPATCEEVNCPAHTNGWRTYVDESATLGQMQAYHIRSESGRHFKEWRENEMTVFEFGAGQVCFASSGHKVSLERDPLVFVRGGDWRANTGLIRRHTNTDDFVDDFANHQQHIADRRNEG